MTYVQCANSDCAEYHVVKGDPFDLPPEAITCGGCGGPVEETEEPAPPDEEE